MTARASYRVGRIRRDNEAAILAAAEREFGERGFSGAAIGRIAEAAGVPRSNVHYYFSSKEELYSTLLTEVVDRWNASFPPITADDDPAEALETYIRAKLEFSRTNPEASKIFASEVLRGAPLLGDYLGSSTRDWLSGKTRVIRSWIRQGKMDAVDPYYLIFMIWSTTQHYADFDEQVRLVTGKDALAKRDYDKVARTVTHIILKGCGLRA
ncbi:MAG: TetR/AcrR family transcriptional regulator [Pseudomonadota bacterium]